MGFIATMVYEVSRETDAEARRLLRAELVGRRWQDRIEGRLMPVNAVWIDRSAAEGQTVDDLHAACGVDLQKAVAAVAATGRTIVLVRAFVQVSGAGAYGLLELSKGETKPSQ